MITKPAIDCAITFDPTPAQIESFTRWYENQGFKSDDLALPTAKEILYDCQEDEKVSIALAIHQNDCVGGLIWRKSKDDLKFVVNDNYKHALTTITNRHGHWSFSWFEAGMGGGGFPALLAPCLAWSGARSRRRRDAP